MHEATARDDASAASPSLTRAGSLPPLGRAPLPPFPGWLAALGPGVIWMALAQGSGELIFWPYLIAKYQLGFLFLLIPACLIQWPLTVEIGRYTALTGESIWQGFIRLHPLYTLPLWALMIVSFLWFGAFASSGGTALAALTGFPSGWSTPAQSLFWAYVTIAILFACLVLSRVIYRFIELFMTGVALVTVVGLALACAHESVLPRLPEFLAGVVWPQPLARPWDPADAKSLVTGLTFAGLGGFWMLFYSYWLREKGVAMAGHAKHMTGLLDPEAVLGEKGVPASERVARGDRIREERENPALALARDLGTGAVPEDTPESAATLRRWLRFLWLDSGIGIFGNILTTLMTCLLAFVLLAPKGALPNGWNIAVVQSEFFAQTWGEVGRALFLVISAAFLSDTWLTTADAVSRVNTDVVRNLFPAARKRSQRWWYFVFLFGVTAVTCATMPLAQPGVLLELSAITGLVGVVCFSVGVWVLNYRWLPERLPEFARPGGVGKWVLVGVCVSYGALVTIYIWLEFSG